MSGSDLGSRLLHLCRFASRATRERVLEPLLADLQFEERRARERGDRRFLWRVRLRGLLGFAQAFVLESTRDASRRLLRWPGDLHAVERETWRSVLPAASLGIAIVSAILLGTAYSRLNEVPGAASAGTLVLLAPSVLCFAIPIGALVGSAFSRRTSASAIRWQSALLAAAALGVITFAMSGWLLPESNQLYRERLHGLIVGKAAKLTRGDREMTLGQLAKKESELRAAGELATSVGYAVEWHKRIAVPASCLALALAGVAIRQRLRRVIVRIPAVILVIGAYGLLLRVGESAGDAGRLAPAIAVWAPLALLAVVAARLSRATSGRQIG